MKAVRSAALIGLFLVAAVVSTVTATIEMWRSTTTQDALGAISLEPESTTLQAQKTERDWQRELASKYNAEMEISLWDRTRVDLVNEDYAIEIDFAPKWAEAIGQALMYAELTGKKPGIILIIRTTLEEEARYVYRCQTVCAKHGIRLWVERE